MPDQHHNTTGKNLSEISHLFLSSIREKNLYGAEGAPPMPRPRRTPPGVPLDSTPIVDPPVMPTSARNAESSNGNYNGDASIDLTPEEFAEVIGGSSMLDEEPQDDRVRHEDRMPPISALIASHLNGSQFDRVREYAAHLCKDGERVGLIQLDAAEFRLSCFEPGSNDGSTSEGVVTDQLDARQMAETLEELNWDVDRWLLHIPALRGNEARGLLRMIDRWVVLATCDHDGVVSCYRTLKGLSDLHDPAEPMSPPTLSLALLDADDEYAAIRVFRKLSGVCQQFLHWPLESEAPVIAAGSVNEMPVLMSRSTRDKAQLATAPQWEVVSDFLLRSAEGSIAPRRNPGDENPAHNLKSQTSAAPAICVSPAIEEVSPMNMKTMNTAATLVNEASESEVIDLPAGTATAGGIVSATLRGNCELVECPVKPPMLGDASLAVARDRRLVLLAVAQQGLSDLRAIGEAWRWLNENRTLIAMAVPQCSIDPHAMPSLRLLVDRADLSATTLQPLLQTGNVTVQTYRKLKWGAKTGLLLEAA